MDLRGFNRGFDGIIRGIGITTLHDYRGSLIVTKQSPKWKKKMATASNLRVIAWDSRTSDAKPIFFLIYM